MSAILAACRGGTTSPAGGAAGTAGSSAVGASAKPVGSVAASPAGVSNTGGATAASSGPSASGGVKLPNFIPAQGLPDPDYPATPEGVPAGYLSYPKNPITSVQTPPGKGGDVTALTYTLSAPVPSVDQNAVWQAVNKDLNANLKITTAALADYSAKLNTAIAGGLPDMFLLLANVATITISGVQSIDEFVNSQCADLTPYLSGDAVKDYPNLANLPSYVWPNAVLQGKIVGVPQAQNIAGQMLMVNQAALDPLGVSGFKSADDMIQIGQKLTKAPSHYAFGYNNLPSTLGPFRTPVNWAVSNGKFTKDLETDNYKMAVAHVRKLWDMALVQPDSPTMGPTQGGDGFYGKKYDFLTTFYPAYQGAWNRAITIQDFKLRTISPWGYDGGKGYHSMTSGSGGLVMLKKAPDARIKELLGILNYLASPFGSREYQLLNFGVQGTDFSFNDRGDPILTQKGQQEIAVGWNSLVRPPTVLYNAQSPEFVTVSYQEQKIALASGVSDPSIGLYSKTANQKGAALNQKLADTANGIVFGKLQMSDWDQMVSDWKKNGGDQIRAELEQAYADANR
ncbi:MAG: extracellular solute-binding protein [Chloroflexi bacterium]|nr:extracellular solute-binding protein [Chloroflexota bacterium]